MSTDLVGGPLRSEESRVERREYERKYSWQLCVHFLNHEGWRGRKHQRHGWVHMHRRRLFASQSSTTAVAIPTTAAAAAAAPMIEAANLLDDGRVVG